MKKFKFIKQVIRSCRQMEQLNECSRWIARLLNSHLISKLAYDNAVVELHDRAEKLNNGGY